MLTIFFFVVVFFNENTAQFVDARDRLSIAQPIHSRIIGLVFLFVESRTLNWCISTAERPIHSAPACSVNVLDYLDDRQKKKLIKFIKSKPRLITTM